MYYNINEMRRLATIEESIREDSCRKKIETGYIQRNMERLYKPIIEPLKQIVMKSNFTILPIEEKVPEMCALESNQQTIPAIEGPQFRLLKLGVLADRYLKTPANAFDHAFGIKPVEGSTNFRLGQMDVKIDVDDFVIDEVRYVGTDGLWRLLTLKNPEPYTSEDLEIYRQMLLQTKPFVMKVNDVERVKCNRGLKYKKIIKPIADYWKSTETAATTISTPEHRLRKRQRLDSITGMGVVFLPSDPDELVAKHQILFGAFQSGNKGVVNEINAINDKLLELGVFDIEIIRKLSVVINEH